MGLFDDLIKSFSKATVNKVIDNISDKTKDLIGDINSELNVFKNNIDSTSEYDISKTVETITINTPTDVEAKDFENVIFDHNLDKEYTITQRFKLPKHFLNLEVE